MKRSFGPTKSVTVIHLAIGGRLIINSGTVAR